jgi:Lipocalin-like domain
MKNVTGTWRLVRASATDSDGNALPTPYGGRAMGRVVLDANGRMMAVVCDGASELPVGVKRDYSSYCGNYTFDGTTLTTRVDAASDASRIGSDQVRGVRFEDGLMVLRPPVRSNNGVSEQRELYWEKISDL